MPASFSISKLKATANRRPEGFVDCLLSRGKIDGDQVHLDDSVIEEIKALYPDPRSRPSPRPSVAQRPRPTNLKFSATQLKVNSALHPAGYVDFILSRAVIDGDLVVLDEVASKELREKFRSPKLPQPSAAELAANFTGALAAWAKAGFKIVERSVYESRHALCQACDWWDAKAWAGSGRCRKCGCSRAKLWLTTSKCPLNPPKW
jgi:hypothetical protein